MKKSIIIVLVACIFLSCSFFGTLSVPVIAYLGRILTVDSSNHFKVDVVYRTGNSEYTFGSDGTYTYVRNTYEDAGQDSDGDGLSGEGWVMSNGHSGTYTWDPETMVLERIIDKDESRGEFVLLENKETYKSTMYFTESKYGMAAVQSATDQDQWLYSEETAVQNGSTTTFDLVATINTDATSYKEESTTLTVDNAGDTTYGDMDERTGTYVILPEGTKFNKGNQVTFLLTTTLSKDKDYDTVNDVWSNWVEDNDQYKESMSITHMGKFIIMENSVFSFRSVKN